MHDPLFVWIFVRHMHLSPCPPIIPSVTYESISQFQSSTTETDKAQRYQVPTNLNRQAGRGERPYWFLSVKERLQRDCLYSTQENA